MRHTCWPVADDDVTNSVCVRQNSRVRGQMIIPKLIPKFRPDEVCTTSHEVTNIAHLSWKGLFRAAWLPDVLKHVVKMRFNLRLWNFAVRSHKQRPYRIHCKPRWQELGADLWLCVANFSRHISIIFFYSVRSTQTSMVWVEISLSVSRCHYRVVISFTVQVT